MFFGTPHKGGNGVSFGKLVAHIASIVLDTNTPIFNHLKKDSESLEQQLDQYTLIADQFDTKFFYETVKTTRFGVSLMVILITTSSTSTTTNLVQVVEKSSAIVAGQSNSESIEMHKSHTEMARMKSTEDNDYQIVAMHTQLMCEEAPKKIEARWNDYDGLHSQFMPKNFRTS